MKIVFVITGLNTGGAEIMLLKILERLGSRFSPHVISLSTLGDMDPIIQSLGVPVEAIGMQPGMLPNITHLIKLTNRLRTLKPNLVHTWMYHADLIGGVTARVAGIKAIAWCIRNSNLSPFVHKRSTLRIVKACAMLSCWIPTRILCCSEVSRQLHANYGYNDQKMVVIPNGFDLSCFRPDPTARGSVLRELELQPDIKLVGLIARFDPQKNHIGFLKAAGLLHQKMPQVHFLLAGGGVSESNIELISAIRQADLMNVTHLLGLRHDVPRLMAALDVLASASIGDAFPNIIGEAMACGVPCAVTDVGDSAYIVGDTGRIVQAGNMEGLAAAMENLLTLSQAERMTLSNAARSRVQDHFDIDRIVKQYETFYDIVVETANKNRC